MLTEIGSIDNVEDFVKGVKEGKGRLQGFGHRVYKNFDPRANIIKQTADEVFEITGKNPLLDIALKLEEVALADDYFISRKLYPNVDFYSGLIYQAMGFPVDMFTVLFAIPRDRGLARALQRAARARSEDRASPPAVCRGRRAGVCADGEPLTDPTPPSDEGEAGQEGSRAWPADPGQSPPQQTGSPPATARVARAAAAGWPAQQPTWPPPPQPGWPAQPWPPRAPRLGRRPGRPLARRRVPAAVAGLPAGHPTLVERRYRSPKVPRPMRASASALG